MRNFIILIIAAIMISQISTVMITFTGGNVHLWNGATVVSDNSNLFSTVHYYEESGIKFEFLADNGSSTFIGDYYHVGNDVIHGHWKSVGGGMDGIKISKIDGSKFDMTYFKVTSNTQQGGGAATGLENVYINALKDGSTVSYSQLVPPSNWGIQANDPEVNLGVEFQSVLAVTFTKDPNDFSFCFGLDQFFVDESAHTCFDSDHCEYCSGVLVGQCTKCKIWNLLTGLCVEFCPEDTYVQDQQCLPCDPINCPIVEVAPCLAGNYIDANGDCVPCLAGSFSTLINSTQCTSCPPETFSAQGASECTPCATATYANGGSDSCTNCPFSDCLQCQNSANRNDCTVCPPGQFFFQKTDHLGCVASCPSGYVSSTSDMTCHQCGWISLRADVPQTWCDNNCCVPGTSSIQDGTNIAPGCRSNYANYQYYQVCQWICPAYPNSNGCNGNVKTCTQWTALPAYSTWQWWCNSNCPAGQWQCQSSAGAGQMCSCTQYN